MATVTTTMNQDATARRLPWDVMGNRLNTEDAPVADVLAQAGLDFKVRTLPVAAYEKAEEEPLGLAAFTEAPTLQAVVRPMGTGQKVLAVTGTRYTPIQNQDAFSVADDLRAMGSTISGAADFRGGGSSLLTVDLPGHVSVRTPQGDDVTDLHLLIRNAHDGSAALSFTLTPVRIACTNALPAAIRGAARSWKISHTPRAEERMNLAHQAIREAVGFQEAFQAQAQAMMDQRMVDAEFRKMVASLWPVPVGEEGTRKATQRQEVQDEVWALYNTSETLDGIRGTRWGGLNAITEYLDHYRPVKGRTEEAQAVARAEGALFGAYDRQKAKVWGQFSLV